MSSQHRIENVTVNPLSQSCEMRCDGEGFTVCSNVLFIECADDANVKYTDCGGIEVPVVLDPVVAGDAQIIQIGGVCYERVGPTTDAVTDAGFDYEFVTCQDCSDIDLTIKYVNCAEPGDIIYIDDAVTTAAIVKVGSKCYSSEEYTDTAADVFVVDADYTTCDSCADTFSAIEYSDCDAVASAIIIRESVAPGATIVRLDEVCYSSTSSVISAPTHTSVDYYDYVGCADCSSTVINARYKACTDGVSEVIIPENQVPASGDVIEIANVCYEFFEFTVDPSTNAAPDASHLDCTACETYSLYTLCSGDPGQVIVSTQYTVAQTIKVDGLCYDFDSTTTDTPDITGVDIDEELADCATCCNNDFVLLLPMKGSDGDTTFTDLANGGVETPHPISAEGDAQVSTAIPSPFLDDLVGAGVLLLDGTGDALESGASPDFSFGTGEFTIGLRFRLTTDSPPMTLITAGGPGPAEESDGWKIVLDTSTTILFEYRGVAFNAFQYSWSRSTGTWYALLVSRDSSNNLRLFIDGSQLGADETLSEDMTSTELTIGKHRSETEYLDGYMSEVYIRKGTAEYTSNYTVPTTRLNSC